MQTWNRFIFCKDEINEAAESYVKDWNEMLASIASKIRGFKAAG